MTAASRVLLPTQNSGDVLGGHAVQMQVDLWRAFDRGPRLWERWSGGGV